MTTTATSCYAAQSEKGSLRVNMSKHAMPDVRVRSSDGDVLFLCLVTFLPQRVRKLLNHPFLRLACGQVDDRQEPRRSNTGSGQVSVAERFVR
jgi:hypothetical protein